MNNPIKRRSERSAFLISILLYVSEASWKVPVTVVRKVTCDECGTVRIETYVVPDTEVKVRTGK